MNSNEKNKNQKPKRREDLTPEDWKKIHERASNLFELSMKARVMTGQRFSNHS